MQLVNAVTFSPDGQWVAVAAGSGELGVGLTSVWVMNARDGGARR